MLMVGNFGNAEKKCKEENSESCLGVFLYTPIFIQNKTGVHFPAFKFSQTSGSSQA